MGARYLVTAARWPVSARLLSQPLTGRRPGEQGPLSEGLALDFRIYTLGVDDQATSLTALRPMTPPRHPHAKALSSRRLGPAAAPHPPDLDIRAVSLGENARC